MNVRPIPDRVSVIECMRCGKRWLPRMVRPVRCPGCRSPYFDRPRQPKNVRKSKPALDKKT